MEQLGNEECVPVTYDEDIVGVLRPIAKGIVIALIVLGLLLDVTICKWRNLTDYIFPLVMLDQVIAFAIPSSLNCYTDVNVFTGAFLAFLNFFTFARW